MPTNITRRGAMALGALAIGATGLAVVVSGCEKQTVSTEPVHKDYTKDELESLAKGYLDTMTLEQKAAQLLLVTPEQLAGVDRALVAGEKTDNALSNVPVGGLFYSGLNMSGEDQIKDMVNDARVLTANAGAHIPAILTVSEEGGNIESPIALAADIESIPTPDAADIGASGDPQQAADAATAIADYLKTLGFNVNFAPNANVLTNPDSPQGARIFSSDTAVVTEMVEAEVKAYLEAGLPCVPKHFPGVGDAYEHYTNGIPVTFMSEDEIREYNLPPFQAAIDADDPLMCISALRTPDVLGDDTPACFSSFWVTDVLRGEMGFDGVVFGARMDGEAVTSWCDQNTATVQTILAGCDMALLPSDPSAARDAILDAVEDGTLTEDRIDESIMRILEFKLAWGILDN